MSQMFSPAHSTPVLNTVPFETTLDPLVSEAKQHLAPLIPQLFELDPIPFSMASGDRLQNSLAGKLPFEISPFDSATPGFTATQESPEISPFDALTGQSAQSIQVGDHAPFQPESTSFAVQGESLKADTLLAFDDLKTMRKKQVKTLTSVMRKTSTKTAFLRPFAQSVINEYVGTLGADSFTLSSTAKYSVISGNGNVFFGNRAHDYLDLSYINSSSARFNLAGINGSGVLYNDGKGARVFDAMTLTNGSTILFESLDRVYFADGYLNLSTIPNDPMFAQQWNLHMMGVHNAWRFTTGSADDVLVGVQDSGLGVDANGYIHADLRTTYIYRDNYAEDLYGLSHGTAVQSIIAANSNNGIGMTGINWNSDVLHLDVLEGEVNDLDLTEATRRMVSDASRTGRKLIINMSLGGDSQGRVGIYPEFEQLVKENRENVLFVIATGNDNQNYLSYPANLAYFYDNVIAVGASWGAQDYYGNPTQPGDRISYPNWWGSNYGYGISLMGPSEVIAADANRSAYGTSFSYEPDFNGTSAATPNVAGVASLVWSANPNLTATAVHKILAQTAYDLGRPDYDLVYGNGFVNADAAVRRAIALR